MFQRLSVPFVSCVMNPATLLYLLLDRRGLEWIQHNPEIFEICKLSTIRSRNERNIPRAYSLKLISEWSLLSERFVLEPCHEKRCSKDLLEVLVQLISSGRILVRSSVIGQAKEFNLSTERSSDHVWLSESLFRKRETLVCQRGAP